VNFVEDGSSAAGEILVFAGSGELQGRLAPPAGLREKFRPRSVVIGPDGLFPATPVSRPGRDPRLAAGVEV
jgi:hypothetical protein